MDHLPLRAHHFLCLTTFQGQGYSPSFVAELARVWHVVRAAEARQARVLDGADAICRGCPQLAHPEADDSCVHHASIAARDRRMREAMGWQANELVELAPVMQEIHARHGELLATVCPGCAWLEICSQARHTLLEPEPVVPRPPAK